MILWNKIVFPEEVIVKVGEIVEKDKEIHTSSYEINKPWEYYVKHQEIHQ